MTDETDRPAPTHPVDPAHGPAPTSPAPTDRNIFGLIALICGIGALAFAVIPLLTLVAWMPAVAAVTLGVIGLVTKRSTRRGQSLTGLIMGAVSFVLAIVMTFVYIALGTALSAGAMSSIVDEIMTPVSEHPDAPYAQTFSDLLHTDSSLEAPNATASGTATDPLVFGTTVIASGAGTTFYEITVDAPLVGDEADAFIAAESTYNVEPIDGESYTVLPVTVKFLGDDADPTRTAAPQYDMDLKFVTADGAETSPMFVSVADPFSDLDEMAAGETSTGTVSFLLMDDVSQSGSWKLSVGFPAEVYYATE